MAESVGRKYRTPLIIHQNHNGEKGAGEKSKSSSKHAPLLSPYAGFAQTNKFLISERSRRRSELKEDQALSTPTWVTRSSLNLQKCSKSSGCASIVAVVNILEHPALGLFSPPHTHTRGASAIVEHIDQHPPEARCCCVGLFIRPGSQRCNQGWESSPWHRRFMYSSRSWN